MKMKRKKTTKRPTPDFFRRVYAVVRRVPRGRVTTYGAIARSLGEPRAARLVGTALRHARTHLDEVPAHRVVNRHGFLTGKHSFATPTLMADLLRNEGVPVDGDRVVDFEQRFWEPPSSGRP